MKKLRPANTSQIKRVANSKGVGECEEREEIIFFEQEVDGGKPKLDLVFLVDSSQDMQSYAKVISVLVNDILTNAKTYTDKKGLPIEDVKIGLIKYNDQDQYFAFEDFKGLADINEIDESLNNTKNLTEKELNIIEFVHILIGDENGWGSKYQADSTRFLFHFTKGSSYNFTPDFEDSVKALKGLEFKYFLFNFSNSVYQDLINLFSSHLPIEVINI
jgi:hypothetical protein